MKQIDVTDQVMGRVSRFEKKRSQRWLFFCYGGLGVLVLIIGFGVWQIIQSVQDQEFLDVFSLYSKDTETFMETWKEAVSFVWDNLPQVVSIVAVCSVILFVLLFVVTRNRRKIMQKRLTETKRYLK